MSLSRTSEVAGEITKAAPPVAITGLTLGGVSLNEWVLLATLCYTLLQMGWFIYTKFIKGEKNGGRE